LLGIDGSLGTRGASVPIRIGTSGFLYEHWRGRLYDPADRGRELERYAQAFETVELNVTFYRMPSSATFRAWASRVPPAFTFAVKASRYLTHVRRLRDPGDAVELLLDRAQELGPHLGPILLQLPPDMPADLDALDATLDAVPRSIRVAVEPRHDSWFTSRFEALLAHHGAALCLADRRGPITPQWRTTTWTYLRFHAGRATPRSCYSGRALDAWVDRLAEAGATPDGYAYFNNDRALRDAAALAERLRHAGIPTSPVEPLGDDILIDRRSGDQSVSRESPSNPAPAT
jgi:uncharacterized protein YecE (DUF72 family)